MHRKAQRRRQRLRANALQKIIDRFLRRNPPPPPPPQSGSFLFSLKLRLLALAGWVLAVCPLKLSRWTGSNEAASAEMHQVPSAEMHQSTKRRRRHRKWKAVQKESAQPRMSTLPHSWSVFQLRLCLLVLVLGGLVLAMWPSKIIQCVPRWIFCIPAILIPLPVFIHRLSGWPMELSWLMMIAICPQWALNLLLCEEKSLEDYVRANAVIQEHKFSAENEGRDAILLCTEVGMKLWSGFIEVIIKAYRCNKSWGGEFTLKDLRTSGHRCRIILDPAYPASFSNLLLDFSKLARLLFGYFKVERKDEVYVRYLYKSMKRAGASLTSTPDGQEEYIKFIRNHPALCSYRQKRLFLEDVMKAYKSMGRAEMERFAKILNKLDVGKDWRVIAKSNATFCRVLFFKNNKQMYVYQKTSMELFRFFRNFFAHGAEADNQGRELIASLEDMDCFDMKLMPSFIVQLVHIMIVTKNTSGKFSYAWKHYGLV